ncbi:hypothetical protein AGMMS49942_29130 [Spirochaetia bacterium]|nr:hypothetical protein AGMMS49942_29130 [Spirochaetia bacterium]
MLAVAEENVLINVDADSKEEVLRILTDLLVKNGCIKPEYYEIVRAREEQYPTGLPTEGVRVAIPHGFSTDCVLKPTVGIATLTRPVVFHNMVAKDEELPVKLVFLFALTGEDAHSDDMQKVMGVFSDGDLLARIYAAKSGSEVAAIMSEPLGDSR